MSPTQVADILVQIVERRRQRMAEARAKQTFTEPPRRPVVQTAGTNDFLAAL